VVGQRITELAGSSTPCSGRTFRRGAEIEKFLIQRGAGRLSHPGGTLYEHLVRVAALLADWGSSDDLHRG
jgi:hypothetical protein